MKTQKTFFQSLTPFGKFRTIALASLLLVAATAAMAQQEQFKFEVTVAAGDPTFAIPVSGGKGGKTYNWNIDWGDSPAIENASGTGSATHAGIQHTYAAANYTYEITITPVAGSEDAWLAAFGFDLFETTGANAQANRDKVTKVISPLTPLMTRSQADITSNTATPPDYEWAHTFRNCKNLTMDAGFTFSNGWDGITTVGDNFAHDMFYGCSGNAFTMGSDFNLPKDITTVGINFAASMFNRCSGAAFTMGSDFNLPKNIATVDDSFAPDMFYGCSGANFTMNSVFNLPQDITAVGEFFAEYMFYGCSGANFTMNSVFNLPQDITAVGNDFAERMFSGCSGADFTMNSVFNLPQDIITVGSDFARDMFSGCSGADFTMNSVFNLPQDITAVGNNFAASMFDGCSGGAFQVNGVFKFPLLAQAEVDKTDVFLYTFYGLGAASPQTRTAASIINGNPTPGNDKWTFTGSTCFADRPDIHQYWGGDGLLGGAAIISNLNPRIGDALTGSYTGTSAGTLTFTWKAGALTLGTGTSYTVLDSDLGSTITLEITSSVENGKVTATETATVLKKTAPIAPAAPTLESKTHNSVTLVPVSGYEYSMNGTTWQTGNVFSGLTGNTAYTFYQRIAETADTEASAASAALNESTVAPPPSGTAPRISGSSSMSLIVGYAATSTSAYTITGTSPVTVSKASGDSRITWNNTTMKLDIDAGISVGNYPVELTASNGFAPDASFTFTLTVVEPVYYTVSISPSTGGRITASPAYAFAGETVTLTITPYAGYELYAIWAYAGSYVNVPLSGSVRTFTMPSANVKVEATFQNPTWQSFWKAAIPIIEAATFTLTQQEAPDANTARYRLAELINEKLAVGMRSAGAPLPTDQTLRSSAADFVISPYDIVIFSFTPANAGTPDNTNGITGSTDSTGSPTTGSLTDGKFEFRVTPPESRQSAYSSGIITASPVGNDISTSLNDHISTSLNDRLRVYVQNGILYVTGLTPGATWQVYNLTGALIYTGTVSEQSRTIATETHGRASLPVRGIYIVTGNNKTVKVLY